MSNQMMSYWVLTKLSQRFNSFSLSQTIHTESYFFRTYWHQYNYWIDILPPLCSISNLKKTKKSMLCKVISSDLIWLKIVGWSEQTFHWVFSPTGMLCLFPFLSFLLFTLSPLLFRQVLQAKTSELEYDHIIHSNFRKRKEKKRIERRIFGVLRILSLGSIKNMNSSLEFYWGLS